MIVDPDFMDHWKTRMLSDLLGGDPLAPIYVLRLWAHCQNRREWVFHGLPMGALKAICRFEGDANLFEKSMIDCSFIEKTGDSIEVCGWAEHNASMIANWKNGKKGGRPRKNKPISNPEETDEKPMGFQNETRVEPIREDRIREDINPPIVPPSENEQGELLPAKPTRKGVKVNLQTYLDNCKNSGVAPVPRDHAVFRFAEDARIPFEFLEIAWVELKNKYLDQTRKRYVSWADMFLNCVKERGWGVWYFDPGGDCRLTSKGIGLKRSHDAERDRDAFTEAA